MGALAPIMLALARALQGFSLIFTYLLQRTGNPTAPAFYILGAGIISVLAALTIAETAGRPLADT